ncbi:MAG: hypothetical protein CVU85_06940 [Firmicutes bacterium HGW-Firmicutes-10]|jgi:hypothetical protein|nr:MAG: hypothetical protein CVU85_06940 [Firmicutes bacterium HGW-Firmicutes-10]
MTQFKFEFGKKIRVKSTSPKKGGHLLAGFLTLGGLFVYDYITLPAWNLRSPSFVFMLAFTLFAFATIDQLFTLSINRISKTAYMLGTLLIAYVLVFGFLSSEMLNAKEYREQIVIKEVKEFSSDFTTVALNRIPVVDKQTAQQLGEKQIGTVQGLGSQYYVDPEYTLVSANNQIYRVSPLQYREFFKWLQNRNDGIPGFVRVNVTNPTDVTLVNLSEGMIYSPSAYFSQDLQRHVRFKYRTKILSDYSFEIDDSGKPYWVISVIEPQIKVLGGLNAIGAIIVDPVSGDTQYYDIADLPVWVDRVQPTEIAWAQIDNWGYYINGFINTLFNQRDMLQTTDGYNYVSIDGQTHVYSGLTSVGSDRSIVGFALINLRNREATFYRIGGADEYAAMSSAEGQVQHLGYRSTFPVLLNVSSIPTYFVSLKDQEGLVKMYSFVAVSNYAAVGVGESVAAAQRDYMARLKEIGMIVDDQETYKKLTLTVATVHTAIVDGNTTYYLTFDEDTRLFVVPLSVSLEIVFASEGDEVQLGFFETEGNVIIVDEFDHLSIDY